MISRDKMVKTIRRLTKTRAKLLHKYPFFGNLLMHLRLGVAECETAYTDRIRIVFDPDFEERLSDRELEFVLLHEVMHCVLNHCERGKDMNSHLFNVACDIVVNSNIMAAMNVDHFVVDGEPAMHLAPNGVEGYHYDAETVYQMLIQNCKDKDDKDEDEAEADKQTLIDRHDVWAELEDNRMLSDLWKERVKLAAGDQGVDSSNLPQTVRELLMNEMDRARLSWKQILRQFVKSCEGPSDYDFRPPDRRFSTSRFIYPGFNPTEEEGIQDIWFCVDTSASVNIRQVKKVMKELEDVFRQVEGLRGKISFFDTRITDPVEITNKKELNNCLIMGGGGTNFHIIFRYMRNNMKHQIPAAIVIMTDGYAKYPDKKDALDVPVLWIIVDSSVKPPWGKCIHI